MKITTAQLREIVREEIKRMKREGYEHITKNDGYTKDKTEPSEYTDDGADIYAAEGDKLKEGKGLVKKSIKEADDAGAKIRKYNDRLKKLQDKMKATKSLDQKAKYQSTMKTILQNMSNLKKAHGIKAPVKESGQRARFALNVKGLK